MIYFIIRSVLWGVLLSVLVVVFVFYSLCVMAFEGAKELIPALASAFSLRPNTPPNPNNPNTWEILRDPLAPIERIPARHDEVSTRH